ncbi:MAG: ankyrin repeat domain-containing protein [Armatimonadetes bacterium]|nr:ankyrin repeat domain-containing protein [Armatimonadota bacterium]
MTLCYNAPVSPLFKAIARGLDLRPLLRQGHSPSVYADFPGAAWTPLHLTVFLGLPEVSEFLLDAGANPNAEILPSLRDGAYAETVGMTSVDVAVILDHEALVELLVRRGGRCGRRGLQVSNRARKTLAYELEKARSVERAESLVVEAVLLPLVEKAQREKDWDEADRLQRVIFRHDGVRTMSRHLRIRGLLARGRTEEALEEASLIFVSYRNRGRYREALQIARCMRRIDPDSARPYELEMEFLVELERVEEAGHCCHQLLEIHRRRDDSRANKACRARFDLLCRRPQVRAISRRPQAWTAPQPNASGNPGNLPALLDEGAEDPRHLWWD